MSTAHVGARTARVSWPERDVPGDLKTRAGAASWWISRRRIGTAGLLQGNVPGYVTRSVMTPPRQQKRSVSLVDVAKLAGVSPSTVSGVFRSPSSGYVVAAATRQKVLEAAAQIGYRPNSLARAMRRQRFQQIGFLVQKPHRSLNVLPESLSGVFDALDEANHHLMFIGLSPNYTAATHALPASFQAECIDALVVDSTPSHPPEMAQALRGSRFPVVYLNCALPTQAVYVDDQKAAQDATLYLINKGRKRIVFFSFLYPWAQRHSSFDVRRQAYFQTMAAAGLKAAEYCPSFDADWIASLEPHFRGRHRPDGIVCYHDMDAVVLQRLTSRLGLRIPDDVAVIGFNGATAATLSPAPIATMQIPWYDMGFAAAKMALQLSEQPDLRDLPSTVFQARLVEDLCGSGGVI